MLNIDLIDTVILDFDGVLTDNAVYVLETGLELVKCNRSDGLGVKLFKVLNKDLIILSSEANQVVSQRAKKLKIDCYQGFEQKHEQLAFLSHKGRLDLRKTLYVGNDINDIKSIEMCAYSACPSDSHCLVKALVDFVLPTAGGAGVVLSLAENCFGVNSKKMLYGE